MRNLERGREELEGRMVEVVEEGKRELGVVERDLSDLKTTSINQQKEVGSLSNQLKEANKELEREREGRIEVGNDYEEARGRWEEERVNLSKQLSKLTSAYQKASLTNGHSPKQSKVENGGKDKEDDGDISSSTTPPTTFTSQQEEDLLLSTASNSSSSYSVVREEQMRQLALSRGMEVKVLKQEVEELKEAVERAEEGMRQMRVELVGVEGEKAVLFSLLGAKGREMEDMKEDMKEVKMLYRSQLDDLFLQIHNTTTPDIIIQQQEKQDEKT